MRTPTHADLQRQDYVFQRCRDCDALISQMRWIALRRGNGRFYRCAPCAAELWRRTREIQAALGADS